MRTESTLTRSRGASSLRMLRHDSFSASPQFRDRDLDLELDLIRARSDFVIVILILILISSGRPCPVDRGLFTQSFRRNTSDQTYQQGDRLVENSLSSIDLLECALAFGDQNVQTRSAF